MALQINKTTDLGEFPTAYLRIARIEMIKPLSATPIYTAFWQVFSDKKFRRDRCETIDNGSTLIDDFDMVKAYTRIKADYPDALDV